ncbi:MAG: DHHA1 domain-containing protein, partial [Acutalibacteraceae bacterium]|nr:DHHA1 domain-containing protein [Acutalibacteraceae bacterium]
NAIRRNHTAAHLLQAGLRAVLGNHVEQAGQLVNEKSVRFDFTHFSALTEEETEKVESFVNDVILGGIAVDNREMPIDEARKLGAMALFGEKYGDVVRVVAAGDKSIELCGGTHVDNAAKIGLFRIISESSVAAGVRRIEAVTGANVIALLDRYKNLINETAVNLKAQNADDIARRAAQVTAELKECEKLNESLESKLAAGKINDMLSGAKAVGNVRVITSEIKGSADELRKMADTVKAENADMVAVFAGINGEKVTFCAACGPQAVANGAHAGNLVREVAKIAGGNGGGKPDSAMAGGKDASKVAEALKAVEDIVKSQIGEN